MLLARELIVSALCIGSDPSRSCKILFESVWHKSNDWFTGRNRKFSLQRYSIPLKRRPLSIFLSLPLPSPFFSHSLLSSSSVRPSFSPLSFLLKLRHSAVSQNCHALFSRISNELMVTPVHTYTGAIQLVLSPAPRTM